MQNHRKQLTNLVRFFGPEILEARRLLSGNSAVEHLDDHVHNNFCGINLPTSSKELQYPTSANQEYQIGSRWSTTASGSTGARGNPLTLTWSVVNDGLSIPGGNVTGEITAPSILRNKLDTLYGSQAVWQPLFQMMFDSWSAVSGTTYVFQATDDGAAFPGSPGVLGTRADVRISGHHLDGVSGVLAYNFFPNTGDMVIDTTDFNAAGYFTSTLNNSRRLRVVLAHEHGHGLGFNHVDPVNQTKLMEPSVTGTPTFDSAREDDTLAANRNYGDIFEKSGGNDTFGTAVNRGTLPIGTDTVTAVSADGTNDDDWYRFDITSARNSLITLAPTGTTYTQGPQGGATASFNAKSQQNLQVQLIASNGTTVLFTANTQAVGIDEVITANNLAAGTYFIKVSDQTGASDLVQMYSLTNVLSSAAVPLTADIVDVAPDPRTTSVSSIAINFSEAINPATFDLTDLTLVRDGFTESLTGATLSTGNNINWTLGNLSTITERVGTFTLTLGTGVQTPAAVALSASVNDVWQMTALNGTSGSDVIRLVRSGANDQVFINNVTVTPDYSFAVSTLTTLTVNGLGGDDVLHAQYTGGNIAPTGGITFDGGANGSVGDVLRVQGSSIADTHNITANSSTRTTGPSVISLVNHEGFDLSVGNFSAAADLGLLDVNVGGTVNFNATQHLDALTIATAGLANMTANGSRTLVVTSLSIAGTGDLDLFNNDMIVDYTAGTVLSAIEAFIAAGRNGGNWLGSGILSTTARTNASGNTTLGAVEGADYTAATANTSFNGEPLDGSDVLVKYTWYGDTNFDGAVDFDDYVNTDSGFNNGLTGWLNGDFDFSGGVDFDDYVLIDNAFNTQTGIL